jgi:hypothetical protein
MADDDRMTRAEWEATVTHHQETQARRQTREMYEEQIPSLSPAVQARWDAWAKSICQEMIQSALDQAAEEMCKQNEEADTQLRKEFADELAKVKKEFTAKVVKIRKETGTRGANVIDLPNPIVRKN